VALVFAGVGALMFIIPLVFAFTALGRADQHLPKQDAAASTAAPS